MRAAPYLASEDSALLRKTLASLTGGTCLEIGAGNGGNLIALSKNFGVAVGSDVVRPGMKDWSSAGAEFVVSDLAACFRDGTFDMVAFNPPYIQSEEVEDSAVDAGREDEVPLAFLREALRVVKRSGAVIMLLSSSNSIARVKEECGRNGFTLTPLEGKHLFFEELRVYRAEAAPTGLGSTQARFDSQR